MIIARYMGCLNSDLCKVFQIFHTVLLLLWWYLASFVGSAEIPLSRAIAGSKRDPISVYEKAALALSDFIGSRNVECAI